MRRCLQQRPLEDNWSDNGVPWKTAALLHGIPFHLLYGIFRPFFFLSLELFFPQLFLEQLTLVGLSIHGTIRLRAMVASLLTSFSLLYNFSTIK